MPVIAYIGLGSNLDDPITQVTTALAELDAVALSHVRRASSLYRSDPMGPPDQPDYINAVAELETGLEPLALLHALQAIEQAHQRVRLQRWGARTLDLDLLLYGDSRIDLAKLTVPHPGIAERNFVLLPLAEIAPDLVLPGLGSLAALLANCPLSGIERLD